VNSRDVTEVKPASGDDADTKATFWKSALETTPGT
jgi:hypothetical protein